MTLGALTRIAVAAACGSASSSDASRSSWTRTSGRRKAPAFPLIGAFFFLPSGASALRPERGHEQAYSNPDRDLKKTVSGYEPCRSVARYQHHNGQRDPGKSVSAASHPQQGANHAKHQYRRAKDNDIGPKPRGEQRSDGRAEGCAREALAGNDQRRSESRLHHHQSGDRRPVVLGKPYHARRGSRPQPRLPCGSNAPRIADRFARRPTCLSAPSCLLRPPGPRLLWLQLVANRGPTNLFEPTPSPG